MYKLASIVYSPSLFIDLLNFAVDGEKERERESKSHIAVNI